MQELRSSSLSILVLAYSSAEKPSFEGQARSARLRQRIDKAEVVDILDSSGMKRGTPVDCNERKIV